MAGTNHRGQPNSMPETVEEIAELERSLIWILNFNGNVARWYPTESNSQ
jgi:hypothetical protein